MLKKFLKKMIKNICKRKKTQKKYWQVKPGFTLIEVIMAMFIFTVMMTAISGVLVSFIKANKYARAIQQDLEDAEYAMNIIAKTLRTSSIFDTAVNLNNKDIIDIYDYSQGKCIRYRFSGNNLTTRSTTPDDPADPSTCSTDLSNMPPSPSPDSNLTNSGNVLVSESGFVRKVQTDSNTVGSVSVLITIREAGTTDKAAVQTSVSLHDYSEVNP